MELASGLVALAVGCRLSFELGTREGRPPLARYLSGDRMAFPEP